MSLSIWNSHSPSVRCFLNLRQGVCGIQTELHSGENKQVVSVHWFLEITTCIFANKKFQNLHKVYWYIRMLIHWHQECRP